MHYLKPYFIHSFFVFNLATFSLFLFKFASSTNTGSFGICMISGSILYFFARNEQAKNIHHHRFDNIVIYVLFFSVIIIFLGAFFTSVDQSIYMLFSIILFIFWLLYELWYCQYPAFKNSHLKLGTVFTPKDLLDLNGHSFHFNTDIEQRSIFIFYNGNWNQFCRAQLKELNHYQDEINQQNLRVFIISSQSAKEYEKLKRKMTIKADYLIDKNNRFAQSVGLIPHNCYPLLIRLMGYSQPVCLPAVVITDIDNIIIYSYLSGSLRSRPICEELFNKIKEIKRNTEKTSQSQLVIC